MFYSTFVSMLSSFTTFAQAKRWNLAIGISDVHFLAFTSLVFDALLTALTQLPILALMIKIMPVGAEGTTYGLIGAAL